MARKAKPKKPTRGEVKDYDGSTPLRDPQQELFCVLYTSNTTPRFFGHGQHSYAFAYDFQTRLNELEEQSSTATANTGRGKKKKYSEFSLIDREIKKIHNVCRASATRLLIRVNIKARCNFLMDSLFTEEIMDRELVYVIQQRHDLQSKVRAWEMAAKLKQRIQDKLLHKVEFDPISGINFVLPEKKTAKAK